MVVLTTKPERTMQTTSKIRTGIFLLNVVIFTQVSGQTPATVPKPDGCGTTRGCFSDCQGSTCNFTVSWTVTGANVAYTLASSSLTPGTWIALGFSANTMMDNDDVIGCASDASGIVSFSALNPDHAAPRIFVDPNVTLTASSAQNGRLSCTIQRPISAATNGRVDANAPWTLLFAKGTATIDSAKLPHIVYHDSNRYWSALQARASVNIDSAAIHERGQALPKPTECGTSSGCFSDCQRGLCGFVVSWNVTGANAVYTITSSLSQGNTTWLALGFSNDTTMDDDDVIGCAPNASGVIVGFSARTPHHSHPKVYNDTELTLTASKIQDGVLSCTLQRPISPSAIGRVNALSAWTLLFATGITRFTETGQPNISYHGTNRYWSASKLIITDKIESGALKPTPLVGSVSKPAGCGSTLGCFSDCRGSTCSVVVTWSVAGNNSIYTFYTDANGDPGTWIAVGFSSDSKMGSDDVLGCASGSSGAVVRFTALNKNGEPPSYYTDTNVTLTSGRVQNGVLSCTIQRPIVGDTNGRLDVSLPWTLLLAKGKANINGEQVQIQKHETNPSISSQTVRVTDMVDLGVADFPLIKAHGSLMIVAWIFLASIGIVLARYYKPVWAGLMCSEKVWFQVHRICMILVFCTTVAGFIIIFVQVDGYSKIDEERTFLVGHPIIGIIVMILTVINPIMALFRPHPGTPRRPIFNWAHWFVGTAAHILGVVNIFFGVLLTKSDVPYYLVYILGAYVAWQLFVEILLEVLTFFGRKMERSDAYEMDADSGAKKAPAVESSCTIIIKRVILVVHCIIVAAFAAVLIGLLAVGNAELEM